MGNKSQAAWVNLIDHDLWTNGFPYGNFAVMDLNTLISAHGGQANLAEALGVNKSYVNRAVKGGLKPALACRIYRKWGHKLGPIEGASVAQIEAIERLSLRRDA